MLPLCPDLILHLAHLLLPVSVKKEHVLLPVQQLVGSRLLNQLYAMRIHRPGASLPPGETCEYKGSAACNHVVDGKHVTWPEVAIFSVLIAASHSHPHILDLQALQLVPVFKHYSFGEWKGALHCVSHQGLAMEIRDCFRAAIGGVGVHVSLWLWEQSCLAGNFHVPVSQFPRISLEVVHGVRRRGWRKAKGLPFQFFCRIRCDM